MSKRHYILIALTAILLAPQLTSTAYACSCLFIPDVRSSLTASTVVFSGEVLSSSMFSARFRVDKIWKGTARSEITMLTGARDLGDGSVSFGSCDYSYNTGQHYIVYASGSDDALIVGGCSRTGPVSDTEIQSLDAIAPHKQIGDEIRACSQTSTSGELQLSAADSAKAALAGVRTTVEGSGRSFSAITDREGHAVFRDLAAGEYKITANVEGYLAKQSTVHFDSGCIAAAFYFIPPQPK